MPERKKIKIYPEKCKGCMFCVDVCPLGLLKISDEVNDKGFAYVYIKDPEKCTGCGRCFIMCPDMGLEIAGKDEKE